MLNMRRAQEYENAPHRKDELCCDETKIETLISYFLAPEVVRQRSFIHKSLEIFELNVSTNSFCVVKSFFEVKILRHFAGLLGTLTDAVDRHNELRIIILNQIRGSYV